MSACNIFVSNYDFLENFIQCAVPEEFSPSETILNIYRSTKWKCIEYRCHTCTAAPALQLEDLDKIQKM